MKRKLLFGERMLLGDEIHPFNTVIPFRLCGIVTEGAIHQALKRLQGKHPGLTALISYDENRRPYFEVPSYTIDIPVRIVVRTKETDWQEESKREWKTAFRPTKDPLIRFIWIKGEDVSEMLFVFHHCLCDGGSAMTLLREFLQVLNDPAAEIGLEKPILGIEDIVPEALLSSRKQKLKARLIGKFLFFLIKIIPLPRKAQERGNDYLIHWKFDQGLTSSIISYCKSVGVTVNTFLGGTILEAFDSVRAKKAFNKVSCPIDIRRFVPAVKDDHIFAFGLMVVMTADKRKNFLDNLRMMQQTVNSKTAKLNPYLNMMIMESSHSNLEGLTKFLKRGKSTNDCMFSNLGRIEIP
ncbi:hypothetical protein HP439_17540, partial [Sphingobacterium shayense]|uniref:condensation domain-containing protein n=1 Tax=Sphingobacterium shayense TaxID=626343 RepID=UPI0015557186